MVCCANLTLIQKLQPGLAGNLSHMTFSQWAKAPRGWYHFNLNLWNSSQLGGVQQITVTSSSCASLHLDEWCQQWLEVIVQCAYLSGNSGHIIEWCLIGYGGLFWAKNARADLLCQSSSDCRFWDLDIAPGHLASAAEKPPLPLKMLKLVLVSMRG